MNVSELEIERLQKQVDMLHNQLKESQTLFQQFGQYGTIRIIYWTFKLEERYVYKKICIFSLKVM